MQKIFIIEDDPIIRKELCFLLKNYSYEPLTTTDFENIVDIMLKSKADLAIIDINLPYRDGYSICRDIRKQSAIPIIIVTSRNTDMDELVSMNLGADDFITKPYNPQILIARISAILRRSNNENIIIKHKGILINLEKSAIKYLDKTAELTQNELSILRLMLRNINKVTYREDIMMELWQSDKFVDDNTLTVNITRLRNKIKSIGINDFIITKRGQGYMV